jgi:hypothetical protein
MTFDYLKSFDSPNGITPGEPDSPGVFSGSFSPVGNQAPLWSFFYRNNGDIWRKFNTGANDWIKIATAGSPNGRNSIALYLGEKVGESVSSTSYEIFRTRLFAGSDSYPVGAIARFSAIAKSANASKCRVRVYDVTNAIELVCLVWDNETTFSNKNLSFSLPAPEVTIELQAKREDGGAGSLLHANLEVLW